MEKLQQARLSWVFVGLLAILCAALVVIQNHWIGEISSAQQDRLRAALQNALNRLSHDFNDEISESCAALLPGASEVVEHGAEAAYTARYARWKTSHGRMFARIALIQPRDNGMEFEL